MRVERTLDGARAWCDRYRAAGLSVGFVPTLGDLHAGHQSLIERSTSECDRTVVSAFVNPTQFGPKEDLAAYPRTPERDQAVCEDAGVHLLFMPAADAMYPKEFETWVDVEKMTTDLCGLSRPHHFRGVTTIVSLLLEVVRPHRAFFGQKDYQQAYVIRRMVRDLKMSTEIEVCPIVREADGLAMSSRNRYLDAAQRQTALALHRSLVAGRRLVAAGERDRERIRGAVLDVLTSGSGLEVDYVEVRVAETLESPHDGDLLDGRYVIAVAATVGSARLIDNEVVAVGPQAAGSGAAGPAAVKR